MAYICDIVLALVIVMSVVLGFRRGLVKTAFKCLSLVAAIALAYFFGSYAGDFIRTSGIYDDVSLKAQQAISSHFDRIESEGLAAAEESRQKFLESDISKTLSRLGFETDSLYEKYESAIDKGTENAKEKFATEAADKILSCLADALGALAVFILALIILKLLSFVFEGIFNLPVLKFVNKLGGTALGLVFGLALAFILCMAVEILLPYIPNNPVIYPGMEKDTVLYSFFLNLNPVILLLLG